MYTFGYSGIYICNSLKIILALLALITLGLLIKVEMARGAFQERTPVDVFHQDWENYKNY